MPPEHHLTLSCAPPLRCVSQMVAETVSLSLDASPSDVIGLCTNLSRLVIKRDEPAPAAPTPFPEAITKCTALRYLSLSGVLPKGGLPAPVAALSSLVLLDVSRGGLSSLSSLPSASFAPSLLSLDVSHSHLSNLPPLAPLIHLTSLNVSSNALTEWPADLEGLTGLGVLEAGSNKGLHLPPFIHRLQQVTPPPL